MWRDRDKRPNFKLNKEEDIITFGKFRVKVMDIVLIKSDENYIFLYCLVGNCIIKNYLRYKISCAEKQLSPYTQFVRIHRSFLVNMMFVNRDKLTTSDLNFKIPGIDAEISIGERFKGNLKKWLSDHSESNLKTMNE